MNTASRDLDQEFGLPLERNVLNPDAGRKPEPFAVHVGGAASAGRTEEHLAGLRLRERNQLLYRPDAEGRRNDQYVGAVSEHGHSCEVLGGIVRKLRLYRRRHGKRGRSREQGIAVSGGFGDDAGSYGAAGSGPVINHDRLAEALAHLGPHHAGEGIGRAAGAERHHDPDRLGRETLP